MDFKGIIKFHETMETLQRTGEENVDEITDGLSDVGEYLNEMSQNGMKIVLARMKEKDFVKFLRVSKTTLMTTMLSEGYGNGILMADFSGELDAFLHTIVLNTLGVLAEEEVI